MGKTFLIGAPIMVADDAAGINETDVVVIDVLANDRHLHEDTHELTVASVDTTGVKGRVTLNADGTISYDPNGQFATLAVGEVASETFTYKALNPVNVADTGTVTVTITGGNTAPIATPLNASIKEDEWVTIIDARGQFTDPDPDDSHTYTFATPNTLGDVVESTTDGVFRYEPRGRFDWLAEGKRIEDTFSFKVIDSGNATSTETVAVTVVGQTDAVNAAGSRLTLTEGETGVVTGKVSFDDADLSDTHSFWLG